jgi:hypothetical protein
LAHQEVFKPDERHRGGTHLVSGGGGDVLLLSMRDLADVVGFCLQYEFEDVVADVAGDRQSRMRRCSPGA